MKLRLFWVLTSLMGVMAMVTGCGSPAATSYYQNEELMDEERSMHYQLTYNTDSNIFVFNEHQFVMRFSVFPDKAYHFKVILTNNTPEPILIDWNRITYLDLDGNPHSVIHEGVEYGAPVSAQTPTVVAPGDTLDDLLRPADRARLDGAMRLMRIGHDGTGPVEYGDQVLLVMPMRVLGQIRQYRFALPVGHVDPTVPWDPIW